MNLKIKEFYRNLLRKVPLYHEWRRNFENSDFFSFDLLESQVRKAISNAPFYRDYEKFISSPFDISQLPIIRKKDIVGHELKLVNSTIPSFLLRNMETGGSTGVSLSLKRSVKDTIKDTALNDLVFSKLGKNLTLAVLRGYKPKDGIYEVMSKRRILLSSYSINEKTLDDYLSVLKRYHVNCIQTFPSSIILLSRHIIKKYGSVRLPDLKGIVASSEIFDAASKKLVHQAFEGLTIIDYYGHNEQACCAYSINESPYTFNMGYGYVELLDTGEMLNSHRVAEIVATSIMNETMPFIRYGTEDYVEVDDEGQVLSIIGRTADYVVNADGVIVPCIVLTRDNTLKNVFNFQYYQDTPGTLHFRVVVNQHFDSKDEKMIEEDFINSFENKMKCVVDVVSEIPRTKVGKQKRLIQVLNLNNYQ